MNELGIVWNLDECIDRKLITTKLKQLEKEGKIEFKGSAKTGGYFVIEKNKL